ncbi:LANO_0C07602g1_1 [Lachancea nothofagi CBS 11611]|uniref:LANO_0C07602g1_1 n=1 Tax=Lachancea nothofagi CBS 11611 TaxID=1266666 RepID=A0A1G4J8T7_9SACH|nr:LANO_0C07602g1_1 [Lachancea nothofagi CBS 11611]
MNVERPELPPKPGNNAVETAANAVPLPESVNLLPVKAIEELTSTHRDKLKDYVMRFENCADIRAGSQQLKDELQVLLQEFESIQARREKVMTKFSFVKGLESEYEASWETLNGLISTRYGENALRDRMKSDLGMLNSQATALESNHDLGMDQFIQQHLELKEIYHLKRQLLHSWH